MTRIDRLARSPFDLFAIVKRIVNAGGQFRSPAEPLADTSTSTGRLLIAVLGGLAERDPPLPIYGAPTPRQGSAAPQDGEERRSLDGRPYPELRSGAHLNRT